MSYSLHVLSKLRISGLHLTIAKMTGRACANQTTDCIFRNDAGDVIGLARCSGGECKCTLEFGWTGDTCSTPSGHLRLMQIVSILIPIAGLTIFIWGWLFFARVVSYTSYQNAFVGTITSRERRQKLRRNLLIILFFTLTGSFLIGLANFNHIRSSFDSSYFAFSTTVGLDVYRGDDNLRVAPLYEEVSTIIHLTGNNLIYYGSYYLVSTIIAVLKGVAVFSKDEDDIKDLILLTTFSNFMLIIALVVTVVSAILNSVDILIAVIFANDVLLAFLVFCGRFYLGRLFNEFATNVKTVGPIFSVARQQLVCYTIHIISGIAFLLLLKNSADVEANAIALTVVYTISIFTTYFLALSNILYCRNAITNLEQTSAAERRSRQNKSGFRIVSSTSKI